jgi:hypothetical protein
MLKIQIPNIIAHQAANSKLQMAKFQINFNCQISMTKTSCKKKCEIKLLIERFKSLRRFDTFARIIL